LCLFKKNRKPAVTNEIKLTETITLIFIISLLQNCNLLNIRF